MERRRLEQIWLLESTRSRKGLWREEAGSLIELIHARS
jgi:hypothetical protein